MPKSSRSIRLQRLQGQVGDVAYEMTKVHFAEFRAPESWQPAINAYRCEHCIRICIDLAGVSERDLRLELAPGRLTIRGHRAAPEPDHADHKPMQVLAMEIDHGYFERQIKLPLSVERDHARVEQRSGLFWIHLPLRHH